MERLNSEKISSEEVSILDNNSEWLGIPKSHLMECAGYSFATEIVSRYNLDNQSKIVIFCGTGNNGGDGFVIARHLSSFGMKSLVVLMGLPEKIRTREATLNWNIISNHLTHSIQIMSINNSKEITKLKKLIVDKKYSIIIDGLLGTGIKGKIREPISSAINMINSTKEKNKDDIKVISIDVPSGLDPNTGKVSDKAVKADLVITFHRNKLGMEIQTDYIKDICVKSIGIPEEARLFVGKGDIIPTLKIRPKNAHKGQFGKVLVIGGSKNYSGAPAYASLTSINFGIDLVKTFAPQVIGDVIRGYSPNMIVRTSPGNWLNLEALEEILNLIEWSDSIVIGPGIGLEKETEELLIEMLKKMKKIKVPLVLDADALKLVKNHLNLIKGLPVILTPHEGELNIMTGVKLPTGDKSEERGQAIFNLAKKLDVTLLVKGTYDYISNGTLLKINRTGCPEMSIGGTGDVLAGLCACFHATKNDSFKSACSAAFLNGYIGEYCKKVIGPRFTTMDLIDNVNESILELLE